MRCCESDLPDDAGLRARPARLLPAAGRRALRPPARRAPAAPRAGGDAGGQRRRQRAGPDVRLAAGGRAGRRAGRGRARLPDRPRRHRRDGALAGDRAPQRRRSPCAVAAARRASTSSSRRRALVSGERPRRRLGSAIATGREGFGRLAGDAGANCAATAWREEPRAQAAELRRAGVPEELARRHAYLRALRHAPDVIAVAQATGRVRSRPSRGRSSLGEDRSGIEWLEQQLGGCPASTRVQRWALQALRDDVCARAATWPSGAGGVARREPVHDAVDAFVEARPTPMRRSRRSRARCGGGRRRPRGPDAGDPPAARARRLRPRSARRARLRRRRVAHGLGAAGCASRRGPRGLGCPPEPRIAVGLAVTPAAVLARSTGTLGWSSSTPSGAREGASGAAPGRVRRNARRPSATALAAPRAGREDGRRRRAARRAGGWPMFVRLWHLDQRFDVGWSPTLTEGDRRWRRPSRPARGRSRSPRTTADHAREQAGSRATPPRSQSLSSRTSARSQLRDAALMGDSRP